MNSFIDEKIDLILSVRQLLQEAGIVQERLFIYDNDPAIKSVKTMPSIMQKKILNGFWELQLLTSSISTQYERFALLPDGMHTDWLRSFESKVLPFIKANNLPISLNSVSHKKCNLGTF